ncbi:hypothetical protein BMULJ_06295 (plasmid) [Burkholderia multivorans ATCC 17616]|uniref:Uncharacterized protein n=2 Tax=Burkholderia multivorans TaxID=87883 RepID=A0A0H3KSP0_BURM1|nr:hypothetical protein B1M_30145 [Burkholderia sp. TJI49]PRE49548.1 hypothetical protein C6P97_12675 [Burkholderia multivorans]PRE55993.1 hypothetical protein C6P99_01100 [Burkholderia multivorans]PRG47298.1 hypothetical protein C6T62_03330 [Burkholderia multivorans]BAG48082.1 hypothetical protein BMULJ_06295 [Burkholderia multivorans ATCC 17616]
MARTLRLVSFSLPGTFPKELVPTPLARFVACCEPGLTKERLMECARARGWSPTWKQLPDWTREGQEAFGFAVTVDGMGVPLVAWMRRTVAVKRSPKGPECDPRQMSLF